jgi:hypothetical protein
MTKASTTKLAVKTSSNISSPRNMPSDFYRTYSLRRRRLSIPILYQRRWIDWFELYLDYGFNHIGEDELIWIYKMIWKERFTFYIDEELDLELEKYFMVEDGDLNLI